MILLISIRRVSMITNQDGGVNACRLRQRFSSTLEAFETWKTRSLDQNARCHSSRGLLVFFLSPFLFSLCSDSTVLQCSWFGDRKGIWPVKNLLCSYLTCVNVGKLIQLNLVKQTSSASWEWPTVACPVTQLHPLLYFSYCFSHVYLNDGTAKNKQKRNHFNHIRIALCNKTCKFGIFASFREVSILCGRIKPPPSNTKQLFPLVILIPKAS